MFIITNRQNLIVNITTDASYVKRQGNDKLIRTTLKGAQAIYSAANDKYYPIETVGVIGDTHTLLEVDEIPPDVIAGYYSYRDGEFYITEEKQAELERIKTSDDMLEMIIDQEYRLTLLELGVDMNDASL